MLRAALVLMAVAGQASAQAPVHLYLIATDPPAGSTLQRGEAFYARVQYQTDREIRIWGRGKDAGKTPGKSHPSPVYAPGAGEALVWFTLDVPGKIDVMRVEAVPPDRQDAVAAAEFPVKLRWEDGAPARARAPWVEPMTAELQERVQDRLLSATSGPGWDIFVALLLACGPGYLAAQAFAFWRMRGRYSIAFWLPVGAMALLILATLVAVLAGSNIAPIYLVFASPFALIYVIVLLILDFRRTSHASGTQR
jgi:hypothetical protein